VTACCHSQRYVGFRQQVSRFKTRELIVVLNNQIMHGLLVLSLLATGVASESILESLGFGMLESRGLVRKHARLLQRQQEPIGPCRFDFQTDIWTSCASLLSEFNLTLDYFLLANPSIGANCSNFQPGATYCLSLSKYTYTIVRRRNMEADV
jgi:hypothetical protein